jgi:nicotinamide-nucleotide adenylyltransferase
MPAGASDLLAALRRPGSPRLEVLTAESPAAPAAVGLLPGSFDPPTVAHDALARGLETAGCGLVLLVWSVRTLPKEAAPGGEPTPPLLPDEARLDCLTALVAGRPVVEVALSSHGLIADQVEAAARRFPGSRLVVGMGSDKVLQLLDPRWYDDRATALDRLTGLATVAYAARAGEDEAVAATLARPENEPWRAAFVDLGLPSGVAGVSSREVRARLRAGEDVSDLVPAEVLPFLGSFGSAWG